MYRKQKNFIKSQMIDHLLTSDGNAIFLPKNYDETEH